MSLSLRPVAIAMLTLTVAVAWAAQPAGADADERAALDALAADIDGWILYSQKNGDWQIMKMAVGEWEPVSLGPGRFARWSPDGSQIAVFVETEVYNAHSARGDVYVMDADGEGRRKVASDALGTDFLTGCPIEWHADGRRLVMKKARNGSDNTGPVVFVDIETGEEEALPLPRGAKYTTEAQITPDGRFMAIRRASPKALVVFDLETWEETELGVGCCASLSPDGNWMTNNFKGHNRLVFHHRTDPQRKVRIRARDYVPNEGKWDAAHWSNHNDFLALRGDNREWPVYICRFDEDPQNLRFTKVTFGGGKCEYPDLFVIADNRADADFESVDGAAVEEGADATDDAEGATDEPTAATEADIDWEQRLRDRLRQASDAGIQPLAGRMGAIELRAGAVREDGVLLVGEGLEMPMSWEQLTAEHRANLAVDLVRKDHGEDHAMAVVFLLRQGDEDAARDHLLHTGGELRAALSELFK